MNVFQSLKNDRVTLVKKDGQRFENLSASVQTGLILTYKSRLRMADQSAPSGIVEVRLPWWLGVSSLTAERRIDTEPTPESPPQRRGPQVDNTTRVIFNHRTFGRTLTDDAGIEGCRAP